MSSSPTIPPRSWWTGQSTAKVPTARTFTLEARQVISCAAARTGTGGTSSTIIKGRQCDNPPDTCAPRRLSATEPLFSAVALSMNGPGHDLGTNSTSESEEVTHVSTEPNEHDRGDRGGYGDHRIVLPADR